MGGCFSGQKGLESENAPVQSPVSPKATLTTENVIETPKEAPLLDVSETKDEEVRKEAEVVAVPITAEPVVEEKAVKDVSDDVKEEAKVAEVETALTGTEDKTNVTTVVV